MKLAIAAVGRAKAGPERDLFDHYRRRLAWPLDLVEVEERRKLDPVARQAREGELLLAKVPDGAVAVVLDGGGKGLSSEKLAEKIGVWRDDGAPEIVFLVGGADGHAESVLKRANFVLSLGKLTWPHMLVRAMLAEQIYRAWSILHNHPYHRGG